jgi:hypothetical protein
VIFLLWSAVPAETPNLQAAIDCAREYAASASLDRPHFSPIGEEAAQECEQTFNEVIEESVTFLTKGDASKVELANNNISAKMRIAARTQVMQRLEAGEAFPVPDVGTTPPEVAVAYKAYSECFITSNLLTADRYYEGDGEFEAVARSRPDAAATAILSTGRAGCPQSRARLEQRFGAYLATEQIPERDQPPYFQELIEGLELAAVAALSRSMENGLPANSAIQIEF